HKDDRDRRGRSFRRYCRRGAAARRDYVNLAADEISGQCGQPIVVALCPAVFDRHILSLGVAGFTQPLAERSHRRRRRRGAGRGAAEETDHRHRLLLRAEGAWRGHRAAEEKHQLAAPIKKLTGHETAATGLGWTEKPRSRFIL